MSIVVEAGLLAHLNGKCTHQPFATQDDNPIISLRGSKRPFWQLHMPAHDHAKGGDLRCRGIRAQSPVPVQQKVPTKTLILRDVETGVLILSGFLNTRSSSTKNVCWKGEYSVRRTRHMPKT